MPKRKRNTPFSAFIFCCTNSTEAECLQRGLFGGPASLSNQKVENILPGTPLLLYNTESKELQGPFYAASEVGHHVDHAWGGNFPVQVYISKSKNWKKVARSCVMRHLWQGKVIPEKYDYLLSKLYENKNISYDLDDLRSLAEEYDLEEVDFNPNSYMIAFVKEYDESLTCKFDLYYTTGTVKTSLLHPGQGRRTQMFRRNVNMNLLATLFENPRTHTGKGYQKKRR